RSIGKRQFGQGSWSIVAPRRNASKMVIFHPIKFKSFPTPIAVSSSWTMDCRRELTFPRTPVIRITEGKMHDVNILDQIIPEAGSYYVMDRGYVDFERLHLFTLCSAFFVVRSKENILLQRRYSHPVDRSSG